MRARHRYMAILLFATTFACRKPYNPPAIASPGSYLVVEGQIDAGSDSTVILLSRTVSLSSKTVINPVSGAVVSVEGDENTTYPLLQTGPGRYACAGLTLDNTHNYRLDIKTGGEQYLSDFEPVLNSPPIDSINFTTTGNSLNIYSNTHDPANKVQYYRWDFIETWIYHSAYDSYFVSNGDTVLLRTPAQQVYTCWPSDTSSNIILASTAKLSRSVIVNNPVTALPSTSDKLTDRYSILVRQYALTGAAYAFWQNMKTNTEQLGSIFDAQPSQVPGNIHSVNNPSEPVIGYISVGSVTSARIFIDSRQLPAWLPTPPPIPCTLDTFYYKYILPGTNDTSNQVNQRINYNKGATYVEIPVQAVPGPPGAPPLGYSASTQACVDCTLYGPNKQPSFWQ